MDGWITIGTKLDNKELERSLKNEENNLRRFEKEAEKLLNKKAKIEVDLQQIEASKILLREMTDEELKTAQTQERVDAILKDEAIQMKILDEGYKSTNRELDDINKKINDNAGMQEVTKQNIEEITQKMQRLNNVSNFKGTIDSIGTSIQNVTKKVVRWGLAIFGVRSAYMFVRQAMSTLSGYNEQLGNDIQYIRFALATTLEPIITKLIQLVYKFLHLLANIIYYFFKINIFAGATQDAFQKTNKTADKMKKTLAGFDEMNILNDNGSVSGLSAGGISDDLSKLGEFEIGTFNLQEWIKKAKKIVDNGFKEIRKKVSGWMKKMNFSDEFIGYWELGIEGVHKMFDGFVDFINGILEVIVGIFTGDTKKIKKGFEDMFKGIEGFFKGFRDTLTGGFGMLVQTIIDAFKKLPEIIYNLFFKKSDKDFETFKNDIKSKFDDIGKKAKEIFNGIIDFIKNVFNPNTYINAWNNFKNAWTNFMRGLPTDIKITYSSEGGGSNAWGGGSGGGGFRAKGGIYYPSKTLKLAAGGIINMPGRGVPYHGATIGERGAEAVVPLTDSQQMALLGEAIGKYITVNATIVNSMNGRVLNRELQKIQNQSSFATNGR